MTKSKVKRSYPSRQGITPKNVTEVKMPRSFREVDGKVIMLRPFQKNRTLTFWEHVQYFFGRRWFP